MPHTGPRADDEPTTWGTVGFFLGCFALAAAMLAATVVTERAALEVMCVVTASAAVLIAATVAVGLVLRTRRTRSRAAS